MAEEYCPRDVSKVITAICKPVLAQNPPRRLIFTVENIEVLHKGNKSKEGFLPCLNLFSVQGSFPLISLLHQVKGGEIE